MISSKDLVARLCNRLRALPALAALAIGLASLPADALAHGKLILGGPGAVVSYPLMHMVETGALKAHASEVEFVLWETHDQLSALLVHRKLDFTAAPVTLPALLAAKGQPVRLLDVSVWGLVWLLSTDPGVKGFADLAGQELLSPFQHDLGGVLLDTLLAAQQQGGAAPVRVRRTRTGQDAVALALSGQGRHVVLAEPMASMLLWRHAAQAGAPALRRVQSLEEVWPLRFPAQPVLPQAGLMANATVAHDRALSRAVEAAYAESARWCKSQARACAEVAHKYLPHMLVAALQQAIEVTRLESRPASAARADLEALYRLLEARQPKVIGGSLPGADFYGP